MKKDKENIPKSLTFLLMGLEQDIRKLNKTLVNNLRS